jgi:hypothetical protein
VLPRQHSTKSDNWNSGKASSGRARNSWYFDSLRGYPQGVNGPEWGWIPAAKWTLPDLPEWRQ